MLCPVSPHVLVPGSLQTEWQAGAMGGECAAKLPAAASAARKPPQVHA